MLETKLIYAQHVTVSVQSHKYIQVYGISDVLLWCVCVVLYDIMILIKCY